MSSATTVTKLDNFIAHAAQVNCVSIGKTSHRFLATGGDDRKVNIWTLGNPSARVVSMPWLLCDSECTPLAVTLSGHTTAVEAVKFDARDQVVLAGSSSGTLKLWNVDQPKKSHTLTGHKSNIRCIDFHPFGEFVASGSLDTNLKIWDIRRKGCIQTYKGHADAINCLQFSPDGHWVVSGSEDGVIKLWDLTAGKLLTEFRGHRGAISTVEFHPNEFLLATGAADRLVKFWDLESFRCVSTSQPEASTIKCLVFSDDGQSIYSGGNDSLRVHGWEPSVCLDSFSTSWGRIKDMAEFNAKLFVSSVHRDSISVFMVDLKQVNHDRRKAKPTVPSVPSGDERPITSSKDQSQPPTNTRTSSKQQQKEQRITNCSDEYLDLNVTYEEVFGSRPLIGREFDRTKPSPPTEGPEQPLTLQQTSTSANPQNRNKGLPMQHVSAVPRQSRSHHASKSSNTAITATTITTTPISAPNELSTEHMVSSAQPRDSTVIAHTGQRSTSLPDIDDSNKVVPARRVSNRMRMLPEPQPRTQASQSQEAHVYDENTESLVSATIVPSGNDSGKATWDKTDRVVIPAHRDKPLDLDFNAFLPAPLIRDRIPSERTDLEICECIETGHNTIMAVMGTRVRNVQVVRHIWERGDRKKALEQLVDLEDSAALSDILTVLVSEPSTWTLDLAVSVIPSLERLIRSSYESYIINACNTICLIVKSFGSLIRDSIKSPPIGHGIDISREERHEKCSLCYENLMVAHEALEEKCGDHGKVGSAVRRADKALHIFDNVKP